MTSNSVQSTYYGSMPDGRNVSLFTLRNRNGLEMKVINYGGIITSLKVPDRKGNLEDIVLGFDTLADYLKENPFFGTLIGRYANRIAAGKFKLNGTEYTVAQNNNGQHLHGGPGGFDKVFWDIEEVAAPEGPALKLKYLSQHMEEGYPGNLSVEVVYILSHANELLVKYKATTDHITLVNLTQHAYFNLSGNTRRSILDHELTLVADAFIPVDKVLIPTGKFQPVQGTPFDFREPVTIAEMIDKSDDQLEVGGGFDHCWVLNPRKDSDVVASLYDPGSGRLLETLTTEPGIQFYSGNFLNGSLTGKYNTVYTQRYGLCLETGHFPDSPNQPAFPSTVLRPGEEYRTQTVYRFSVKG